jgi:hypothetical protein
MKRTSKIGNNVIIATAKETFGGNYEVVVTINDKVVEEHDYIGSARQCNGHLATRLLHYRDLDEHGIDINTLF